MKAPAEYLDKELWNIFESVCGFKVPQRDSGLGWECVATIDVPQPIRGQSFQQQIVRLPVKRGGMGLRSIAESCLPAFVGSVEMAIPAMVGEGGVCPGLARVIGDEHTLGDANRWNVFISSGCCTGVEFASSWNQLKQKAEECAAYAGKDLGLPLVCAAEFAGEGETDGSTRHQILEQREGLRSSVLVEYLRNHSDPSSRPVWAFPQMDKMSSQWILSLPEPETGLNSPVFREALAIKLCAPSPACATRVGQHIGGPGSPVVDPFGDVVNCWNRVPGDTWRIKHYTCKKALMDMAIWARVPCDSEILGLFSDLIPAEAVGDGGELQDVRARQGKVPNLRVRVPHPTNGQEVPGPSRWSN